MTDHSGYPDLSPTGCLPDPAGRRDWRPAVYVPQLHRISAAPVLLFGGRPVAGTACGQTAYADADVRGGQQVWRHWLRCVDCEHADGSMP